MHIELLMNNKKAKPLNDCDNAVNAANSDISKYLLESYQIFEENAFKHIEIQTNIHKFIQFLNIKNEDAIIEFCRLMKKKED